MSNIHLWFRVYSDKMLFFQKKILNFIAVKLNAGNITKYICVVSKYILKLNKNFFFE